MKHYLKLTDRQIAALEEQSCRCDDWSNIEVADDFNPKYVRNAEKKLTETRIISWNPKSPTPQPRRVDFLVFSMGFLSFLKKCI